MRWDRETVYDMHFVSHPPDRTLFAGVYQLPPASYLLTDGEQVRVIPYWDWDYPSAQETQSDGDGREWVRRLERSLEEAVRLRLRADVPVGVLPERRNRLVRRSRLCFRLSRSRSVPTRSRSIMPTTTKRLLRASRQRGLERSSAASTIRADQLADHFSDAIYHAERPFANAHAIAKYLLSEAVRNSGIKVVLTGEGSDEIFAGYPHFRRDLVLYASNGQDPATTARLLAELDAANRVSSGTLMPQGSLALDSVKRVLGFVPSNLEGWAQIGKGLLQVVNCEFQHEFFVPRHVSGDAQLSRCPAATDRSSSREPVALHLGQDDAAELRPQQSWRPHGDGPLHRRTPAVSRPPRRRGGGTDAGEHEDPRDDGKVRAPRSSAAAS